jgi:tRNA G18 (ribose-2'-O)-methylase SpoU
VKTELIDDPSDPRVADYRDLTDADLRRRRGLFVAEGREIVGRLLAGGRFRTRSVLVTPPALEGLRDHLAAARAEVRVYLAPPEIVHAIVGYKFHLGCLAVGERGTEASPAALIDPPGPRLLLALDDVTNPDNVGGIFRNAVAFGADAVLLSARCADPLYRKAIRVSVGGSLAVPFCRLEAWREGLGRLRESGYTIVALTPHASAADIAEFGVVRSVPARLVLALGAEDHGLRAETRSRAHVEVRIAMAPGADSLNVATASGIALHRLRQRGGVT